MCSNENNELITQSKYLYNLPVNSDFYFKLNTGFFNKYKNLHKFFRFKQINVFFNSLGINFIKDVKYIYGSYCFNDSIKNSFYLKGKFKINKIKKAVANTHIKFNSPYYDFYASKLISNYSLSIKSDINILISKKDSMYKRVPDSRVIFNALNILKRVNYLSQNWILIYSNDNTKAILKKWPILEILSMASFFSVSLNPDKDNNALLKVDLKIYVWESTYTGEILTTLENYINKLSYTYPLIKNSFYNLKTYYKGNFAQITFSLNLNKLKITE